MAEMIFIVNGGGDMSVGIPDTHATITVKDNFSELDKTQMELFREFLREFYDIPKGRGEVQTLEEYEQQEAEEQLFYAEMNKEHEEEKERAKKLSSLDMLAMNTLDTKDF